MSESAEPPAKRRRVVVGNTKPESKVQAGGDIFSPPINQEKVLWVWVKGKISNRK